MRVVQQQQRAASQGYQRRHEPETVRTSSVDAVDHTSTPIIAGTGLECATSKAQPFGAARDAHSARLIAEAKAADQARTAATAKATAALPTTRLLHSCLKCMIT